MSLLSPDQADLLIETFQSDGRWACKGEPRVDPPNAVKTCRIDIELYTHECPKAVKNFKLLCQGTKDKRGNALHYKGTTFHRFVKDFCLQGGDINGKGGDSIYNGFFKDEKAALKLKHDAIGIVSMANSGPNTNRSQFFFTLSNDGCHSCDGNHVIIGKVTNKEGLAFLELLNGSLECREDEVPSPQVFVADCG